MTLSVAITVLEGIVLASDSRTTYRTDNHWRIASDHAEKMVALGNRFLVNTAGASRFTSATTAQVIRECEDEICACPTTKEAAGRLSEIIYSKVPTGMDEEGKRSYLHFHIAGYDLDGVGRVYAVEDLSGKKQPNELSTTIPWFSLLGDPTVAYRILWGVDIKLDPDAIEQYVKQSLNPYYPFYWYAVPDAVAFSEFLIEATHKVQVFSNGRASDQSGVVNVGGPIDTATLNASGVHWVRRKNIQP